MIGGGRRRRAAGGGRGQGSQRSTRMAMSSRGASVEKLSVVLRSRAATTSAE